MTPEDEALLTSAIEALEGAEDAEEGNSSKTLLAFRSMLARRRPLTPKQRAWVEGIAEGRYVEPEPEYQNLVSSGLAPRGREVETPAVLLNLPKRPPGRSK